MVGVKSIIPDSFPAGFIFDNMRGGIIKKLYSLKNQHVTNG